MKKDAGSSWLRGLLILPPLLVGIVLLVGAGKFKKPPQKVEQLEKPVSVRVIKAVKTVVVPTTNGYGVVRPGRIWQAVAKVAGPVSFVHDKLKAGVIIAKGQELIRLDPGEYQLAIEQIDAELAASKVKAVSAGKLLKIEERNTALIYTDLKRKQVLKKRGSTTQVAVDAAQRAHLAAQTKSQGLINTIAQLEAEQKVLISRRANATLNLHRTVISAPFDLRITEVLTELDQYAGKGQVLVKADGIASMEVTAHIPLGRLRYLVRGTGGAGWLLGAVDDKKTGPLKLKAVVRSKRPHGIVSWPATVLRVAGSLDPQTQTVGIVVSVKDPYGKAIPGVRPILAPNTFVEVKLAGRALKGQIVIPSSALHQEKIYILNADKRLEIRPIKIKFRQGGIAVIAKGLNEGEKIVLTDLVPAIKGMLLKPKGDKKAAQNIRLEAQGKSKGNHKPTAGDGGAK